MAKNPYNTKISVQKKKKINNNSIYGSNESPFILVRENRIVGSSESKSRAKSINKKLAEDSQKAEIYKKI